MSSADNENVSFWSWIARPQSIIALSALLLSGCGLFIAIYEANLIRRQQRASAWPHVEVAASLTGDRVRIWVRNAGVGPATVRAAGLIEGRETREGWAELIRSAGLDENKVDAYFSWIDGGVLPRDSDKEVIFEVVEGSGDDAAELVEWLGSEITAGRVDVAICYCSVYDECWMSSLRDVFDRSRASSGIRGNRRVESCDGVNRSAI